MKHKVGDKVRIKSKEWWDAQPKIKGDCVNCGEYYFTKEMIPMCGKVVEIAALGSSSYNLKGCLYHWTDEMFEEEPKKEENALFKAIIEAAKQQSLLVEQTEDGGVKISPIEEKPKYRSGIYFDEENNNVYVVFGGGIHMAVGYGENGRMSICFQDLDEKKRCGEIHGEEWKEEKPTVHIVIDNKKSIALLRDALDDVEKELNNKNK